MLGWSINLFRVAGIRLAVHFTFLILLAYEGWEGWSEAGWFGLGFGVVRILLLFTCVTLHAFGHALTAQRFGVRVPRILLLPIGGMAQFESIPREPSRELLITIAGPAVNFVLAALLWPLTHFSLDVFNASYELAAETLLKNLLAMNLIMGCFNLLPVFPMDGGRIFRALLALKWPYLTATRWAAGLGKVLAIAGVVVMAYVFDNTLGALLFVFIFIAGDLEYRTVKRQFDEEAHWAATLTRLYHLPPVLPTTSGPLPPVLEPPRLDEHGGGS